MTDETVKSFYDRFSKRLLLDLFVPNRRVLKQFEFVKEATPSSARRILVVGVGTGEIAHFLASGVAPSAQVVGVDISSENLRLARRLFRHPRVIFERHDILESGPEGPWDVVVFPDSYEHLPADRRAVLHGYLARSLAPQGRVLLACPTVMKQESLREAGSGLQVIDEDVDLSDVERLAKDVGGVVTHFSMVQIWATYDYFHAVVERGVAQRLVTLGDSAQVPLHRGERGLRRLASLSVGYGGLAQSSKRLVRTVTAFLLPDKNGGA